MAEKVIAPTKAPETKQICSNFNKRKPDFHSSGSPDNRRSQLQKTAENQAVQKLIKSRALQAKLRIGQPNDIYEQKADSVADQVMRMPDPILQRRCAKCDEDKRNVLQTKRSPRQAQLIQEQAVPPIVQDVLRSSGKPLDAATRAYMEPRFGHDFSRVRVHTDVKAAESAKAVNALAFTVGRNVVFGTDQYVPYRAEGKRLLAHELVHVLQQQTRGWGGPERVQRQQGPKCEWDPRAAVAASNAYAMKSQESPGIWFDDWNDDERDNDGDNVIDGSSESGTDGGNYNCNPWSLKCSAGVYSASICSGEKRRRTDDPLCSRQSHSVIYRVCIDIPRQAYHKAGLVSFPNTRDVSEAIRQLSTRRDWKVFRLGNNLMDGDFVANSQHSGIVYQGQIIHLPGQTGRRQHYNSALPSQKNDIEMTSDLWHGGFSFRARPVKDRKCVPLVSFRALDNDFGEQGSPSISMDSDMIGLTRNDGITYGTWDRRPRVERLQDKLNKHGAVLNPDGMFGEETAVALRQFQVTVGLLEDDTVDPATVRALETYAPEPDQPAAVSHIEGLQVNDGVTYGTWDRRPRVGELQERLSGAGFPCKVDGMFGPMTAKALHSYQATSDLPQSDTVNRATADALEGRTRDDTNQQCREGEIPWIV